jgi:hypothetical protein
MTGGSPRPVKITFTAEAAEIAKQEPREFSAVLRVLGGSFSGQVTEKSGTVCSVVTGQPSHQFANHMIMEDVHA